MFILKTLLCKKNAEGRLQKVAKKADIKIAYINKSLNNERKN